MWDRQDRREEARLALDSPAVLLWEDDRGTWHAHGRALNLSATGMTLRVRAPVKPGQIVWCGVPSQGVYSRALVVHVRGFFRRIAGVRFLSEPLRGD